MTVVSNTSPISNLTIVGGLDLLRELYHTILIPPPVAVEIAAGKRIGRIPNVDLPDWIHVGTISDYALVDSLQLELDVGESETIALAIETNSEFVLMDERKGRNAANSRGLRTVGLLGVLIDAKARGLLVEVKPILDDLVNKAEFWVSDALYQHVLAETGETSSPSGVR